jgi:D-glycero-D-manno-heptose 1,7-bisphosphate phosphatase
MNKVIFLDRDGTVNVDYGYVRQVNQWEWTEKAQEALGILQAEEYKLVVVTNQSGIAYGMYSLAEMKELHDFMVRELANAGVKLAAIAYCAHDRSDGCICRKPRTGMARKIEKEIGAIDYQHSWMIGDKISDMKFGKNLGTKTALIRSKYWQDRDLEQKPTIVVNSLYEFSKAILSNRTAHSPIFQKPNA